MSKKIEVDSVANYIVTNGENHKILHYRELRDCLDILLTEKQKGDWVRDITIDFIVGEKRFKKFLEYIEPNNKKNMWRVDKKRSDYFYENKFKKK